MATTRRLSEAQRRALAVLAKPGRAIVAGWVFEWDGGEPRRLGYLHTGSVHSLMRLGLIGVTEGNIVRISPAGRAALASTEGEAL